MTGILSTAAYIQNRELLQAQEDKQAALQSIQRREDTRLPGVSKRIWELLETPQTIESLSRVVATEYEVEPTDCTDDIKASLAKLYREELIQVSPDS